MSGDYNVLYKWSITVSSTRDLLRFIAVNTELAFSKLNLLSFEDETNHCRHWLALGCPYDVQVRTIKIHRSPIFVQVSNQSDCQEDSTFTPPTHSAYFQLPKTPNLIGFGQKLACFCERILYSHTVTCGDIEELQNVGSCCESIFEETLTFRAEV